MARKGIEYFGLKAPVLGQAADVLRDVAAGLPPETVAQPVETPAAPAPTILGLPQPLVLLGVGVLALLWLGRD